jgi:hypothetical protein
MRGPKERMSFALGQTAFSGGLPQTAADARKPQRKQAFAMQNKLTVALPKCSLKVCIFVTWNVAKIVIHRFPQSLFRHMFLKLLCNAVHLEFDVRCADLVGRADLMDARNSLWRRRSPSTQETVRRSRSRKIGFWYNLGFSM